MEELSCPNPDCRVAETGKCVEGFAINECPHQVESPSVSDEQPPIIESEPEVQDEGEIAVASGQILSISEATDVLCAGPTRVVAIVGPVESGKTTFGISLYGAFQHRPFDKWNFVGSLTLPAFEERCHLARLDSRRLTPETPRTPLSDGLGFLHLAVHSEETGRVDLLIPERSGESYTAAADSQDECQNLHEVSRADYLLFFVDGKKLAGSERHGVKNEITLMVRAMIESGIMGQRHSVGIVLTKYDYVKDCDDFVGTEKYFSDLVIKLQAKFGSSVSEMKAFKIAARPEDDSTPPLFGVLEIFEEWLRPTRCIDYTPSQNPPLERTFQKLQVIGGGEDESK